MTDAGEKTGLNFDVGNKIKSRMQAAGFVNVTEYRMQWDIGDWSEDEHRKIGELNLGMIVLVLLVR